MNDPESLAHLAWLQLQDSSFPAGRFAHSNGLEGWLSGHPDAGEADIADLARSFLAESVGTLDAVALAIAWSSSGLGEQLALDQLVTTYKISCAARSSSQKCGRQLALVAKQTLPPAVDTAFLDEVVASTTSGNQAVVEGVVHRSLGVPRDLSVLGFLRSSYAGMLSAAVRLGRVGPIWAQQCLFADRVFLSGIAARALVTDIDDVATCTPELEIYAMAHETSSTRLFTT